MGDAIDIAQRAGGVFVHEGDGVLGEEILFGASELQPVSDALGDIVCAGVVDGEAMMDAGEEGAVAPSLELVFELW